MRKGIPGRVKLKRETEPRRHQLVQQRLLDMILNGELAPGDQLLPERDIAKALGVSRPSVRQAISSLASLGLVQVTPRGSYVTAPDLGTVLMPVLVAMVRNGHTYWQFLEFRMLLEVEAARLAAGRRTVEDFHRLEYWLRSLEEAVRQQQSALEPDFQFHLALAAASHNDLLHQMIVALLNVVRHEAYAPLLEAVYAPPGELAAWVDRSREIVAAIRDQNTELAARAMRSYLERVAEITLGHFAARQQPPMTSR